MTPAAFLTAFAEAIANDGALILLVMVILWMGARKKWYWGWTVDSLQSQMTDERIKCLQEVHDIKAERDLWRTAYLFGRDHPDFKEPPVKLPPLPPKGD